jgi:predicted MPP superfamily phosphohydrolase
MKKLSMVNISQSTLYYAYVLNSQLKGDLMMKLRLLRFSISLLFIIVLLTDITQQQISGQQKLTLNFRPDGSFIIVQFADIQDGPDIDPRTIRLMNKILDKEKPDLVVLTGDNVDNRCDSSEDVKTAINNIAEPMEKRSIPWAIIFGNHDDDHGEMTKEEMMKVYMSYDHNISQLGPKNIGGVGNYNILIKSIKNNKPIFNIYLLDSGEHGFTTMPGHSWIKFNQISWYRSTSKKLKSKYKSPLPSLMFFHIPLPEWREVWQSGNAIGEKHEEECTPSINSGLFASLLEMGDVKGVFVGHDHVNDYVGELYGIKLGYSRNVGYGTYGLEGFSRGGRVFILNETNPDKFETYMKLESDFR